MQSRDTPFTLKKGKDYSESFRLKPKHFFTGACYLCGCSRHMQALCPLRVCPSCFEYGHSEHLCRTFSKRRYR